MRSWMICYVAGITTIVWLPQLLPRIFVLLFLILMPLCWRLERRLFACMLGVCWALIWGHWQLAHRLDSFPLRTDWTVEGYVAGLPVADDDRSVRFHLVPASLEPLDTKTVVYSVLPRRLALSWYRSGVVLRPGDRVKLQVRLRMPHGYANPNGTDHELRSLAAGIDATGYVRQLLEHSGAESCSVDCIRYEAIDYILRRYTDERHAGLLRALMLGDRGGITQPQWQLLADTGTLHLAVISGLHIGFAALLGAVLLRVYHRAFPLPYPRAALVVAMVLPALCYTLLAGSALPTQRALVMLAVFAVAYWRLWFIDLWTRWWIAMAAVLTLSPLAQHQAGFWLSFLAVASILWGMQRTRRSALAWRVQLVLTLSMAPVLLYAFGALSLIAPLVNLMAIPLIGLLLVSAVADLCLSLVDVSILLTWVAWLCDLFWRLVELGGAIQGEMWRPASASLWALLLALIGIALVLQPSGTPLRVLGMVLCVPLVAGEQKSGQGDGFEAWVFDVGQGLAVLVQVGERHLLYDTGPGFPGGGSALPVTVLPYLQARQIGSLDRLVLSHNDIDHSGGYSALLSRFEVGSGLTGSPELAVKPGFSICAPGMSWRWQGVEFQILAGGSGTNDNNRSCVVWIGDKHCSLLVTGDVDGSVERGLNLPEGKLDWLVAGHHGSKHSSTTAFLERWRPVDLIFSAGYANRFGHPDEAVLARAENIGAGIHVTARHGAVRLFRDSGGECRTVRWRDEKRRFWSGY